MTDESGIRVALFLVDLLAKSTVILALAGCVSFGLRRSPAASRHLVWVCAFVALLALPVLSGILPSIPVGVVRVETSAPAPAMLSQRIEAGAGIDLQTASEPGASAAVPESVPTVGPSNSSAAPQHPSSGPLLMAIWLAGSLAVLVPCGFSVWTIMRWRRMSRPVSLADTSLAASALSQRIGLKRIWDLRRSAGPVPPTALTWGLIKPVVLMPEVSADWSEERLEAVLLHELAHVRRRDSVTQMIAVAACALYWYNPAVWLCARAMRAEAESAADDTVIRLGVRPSVYAQELLGIASDLGRRRQLVSIIGVPIMKRSKIESRVKAILDPTVRRTQGVTRAESLVAVSIAGAIALSLGLVHASSIPQSHPDSSALTRSILEAGIAVPNLPTGSVVTSLSVSKNAAHVAPSNKRVSRHLTSRAMKEALVSLVSELAMPVLQDGQDESAKKAAEKRAAEKQQAEADSQKHLAEKEALIAEAQKKLAERDALMMNNQKKLAELQALAAAKSERSAQMQKLSAEKLAAEDSKIARLMTLAQLKRQQLIESGKSAAMKEQAAKLLEEAANHRALTGKTLEEVRRLNKLAQAHRSAALEQAQRMRVLKNRLAAQAQSNQAVAQNKQALAALRQSFEMARAQSNKETRERKIAVAQVKEVLRASFTDKQVAERREALEISARQALVESQLAKADVELADSKKRAERSEALYRQGAMSGQELERVQTALRQAEIQLQVARALLDAMKKKP
ncbi:MAG: M56 family metallopeptidase [Fimbriimonas sp.]|nr:M56 family metallopeptidase [Fimbriimonas sp.]